MFWSKFPSHFLFNPLKLVVGISPPMMPRSLLHNLLSLEYKSCEIKEEEIVFGQKTRGRRAVKRKKNKEFSGKLFLSFFFP